jgi:hypothetical protein
VNRFTSLFDEISRPTAAKSPDPTAEAFPGMALISACGNGEQKPAISRA